MSIGFDNRDGVARVTIDRTERMNAIDAASERELETIWRTIEGDGSVRCVVITGAGERSFCAGADLRDPERAGRTGLDYWSHRWNGFAGISLRRSLTVPVIARVNGFALGGGFEIVLGADIAVAAEHAMFALPEPRVGVVAIDGGAALAPRHLPYKIAMSILLSGRRFTAAQMLQYGLLNEVVPADALDKAVDSWVSDILLCSPSALKATKQLAQSTIDGSPYLTAALRTRALVDNFDTGDSKEGAAAFREKRKPRWVPNAGQS
jgi:crotonobetainyl-CoA hydratase